MYRKILEELTLWKNNDDWKPLLITGARQTGKTYIVRFFANEYFDDYLEINFEKEPNIKKFFSESIDANKIMINLENYYNKKINPCKTLIFFDEIQNCEEAITSLKYFYDCDIKYKIIAAGSLLGVVLNRKNVSFPVGKVEELKMFPMDFEEFLLSLNETILLNNIKDCYEKNEPLNEVLHQKALQLYRSYLAIGGMPEAVQKFIKTNSYISASKIVETIYKDYLNDLPKYTTATEAIKNVACYKTIVSQLFKENKNFRYSEVIKGKNSQYFGSSIQWLICSGICLKSSLIDIPRKPLSFHANEFIFRMYLSDVGMFRYCTNMNISLLLDTNYRDDVTGILSENYVACEFAANDIPLYYWIGKRESEIEFLIEGKKDIIPVEVKSGKRVTSKSLNVYKEMYAANFVYRISGKNFGFENGIKSVPLYSVFCLAKEIKKSEFEGLE